MEIWTQDSELQINLPTPHAGLRGETFKFKNPKQKARIFYYTKNGEESTLICRGDTAFFKIEERPLNKEVSEFFWRREYVRREED